MNNSIFLKPKSVSLENVFMQAAKDAALDQPESLQPFLVGCVVVKDNKILGRGNNHNNYHQQQGCERRKKNIPSFGNYDVCPGCNPQEHSEPRAIADALKNGHDISDASIYMYSHYYACQDCLKAMAENRIADYYVAEGAENLFSLKNSAS